MTGIGNYFIGNGEFEVREMAFRPLQSGEVLLKNMACGVCGTDVHIMKGEKGSADVNPPVVLGHEYAGLVLEIADDVRNVRVGDQVTVDPNIYCGRCRYCHNGQKHFCESMQAVGVTRDGGFAQYSIVPCAQVFPMNPDIGYENMAMAEPLACCLHGIAQIDIHPGDAACVVGGGAIGLIMAQLLKLKGAGKVYLSEAMEERRKRAWTAGFVDKAFVPGDRLVEEIREELHRPGMDVVVECAGNPKAVRSAIDMADRGGRVLLFSVPKPDSSVELPLFDVYKKELKISGSFINPDTHQQAVELLNSGRVNMQALFTHRFPLKDLATAIQTQATPAAVKVLVKPWEE